MEEETVVRSSCLSCGTIDLAVADVTVYVARGAGEPTYGFQCPRCLRVVRKSTSLSAVALLAAAGVRVVNVPDEAREVHTGQPLTEEDLDRLVRLLDDTDALARFAEGPARD